MIRESILIQYGLDHVTHSSIFINFLCNYFLIPVITNKYITFMASSMCVCI